MKIEHAINLPKIEILFYDQKIYKTGEESNSDHMDAVSALENTESKSDIPDHKTVVASIFQTIIPNNVGYTVSSCWKILSNYLDKSRDPDVIVIDIEPIMHMTPAEFQKILMFVYGSIKFESTANEIVKNLILKNIEELIADSKDGKHGGTRIITLQK